MHTAVVGAGYTGLRVLQRLETAVGYSRSAGADSRILHLDLDSDRMVLPGPAARRILYTVPPRTDSSGDPRLAGLLAALHPALPERIVYLSTSGVYGDCQGELVNETRTPRPATPRAVRRHAAETILEDWCSKSGVRCIILRVPGIYGPGRLGVERIRSGAAYLREQDANPGNRIHVDDLASASIAALERSIPGGIYNLGDGDFRSSTWFALTVARLAGLAPPPLISREDALQLLPAKRLSYLGESRRLDTRKMREVLGFEPGFGDAEDGIRASLREDGLL